jgi:uncharacterized repeat protein (TIGR04138 family)
MHEKDFSDVIDVICTNDPRYLPDAYYFIREALDFAVRMYKKPADGIMRHVSATELLEGIRVYTLQEYGPMALTVLRSWGLTCTEDIGEVVFNLVESGKLGKTEGDRKEDFAGGYDFEAAFLQPFLPREQGAPAHASVAASPRPDDAAPAAAGQSNS